MVRAYSILRLTLATLVCVGFCGLSWAQLSEAPQQTRSERQAIQEFACEGTGVFAVNHENNVDCQVQTGPGDAVSFIFGLSESFTTARPVLLITGRVTESVAKEQSVLCCRMKNKDPPVV